MLELENVSVVYDPDTKFQREALNNVNLRIDLSDVVAVVGKIGSGKSTLIQLFNGLIKPTSGRVLLDGIDITKDGIKRREIIRKIGLVFQYPEDQLFAETVFDEVAFGPINLGFGENEVKELVEKAVLSMGIDFEKVRDRSPLALSGGEKRRIAIASVIAMNPNLLVLDEPTAGMDFEGRKIILSALTERAKRGQGVVLITHDMEEALAVGKRLVVLDRGSIGFDGIPEDFFTDISKVQKTGLAVPFGIKIAKKLESCNFDVPLLTSIDEIVNYLSNRKKRVEAD